MHEELDKKLVKDFPLLFTDRHGDMKETCMCWGFDCGNGWYKLIREASEKLEPLIAQYKKEHPGDYHPRAVQVKEKFGTLRFYMSSETDEMGMILTEVEDKSDTICEECGSVGELRTGGWLKTLCANCYGTGGRNV